MKTCRCNFDDSVVQALQLSDDKIEDIKRYFPEIVIEESHPIIQKATGSNLTFTSSSINRDEYEWTQPQGWKGSYAIRVVAGGSELETGIIFFLSAHDFKQSFEEDED